MDHDAASAKAPLKCLTTLALGLWMVAPAIAQVPPAASDSTCPDLVKQGLAQVRKKNLAEALNQIENALPVCEEEEQQLLKKNKQLDQLYFERANVLYEQAKGLAKDWQKANAAANAAEAFREYLDWYGNQMESQPKELPEGHVKEALLRLGEVLQMPCAACPPARDQSCDEADCGIADVFENYDTYSMEPLTPHFSKEISDGWCELLLHCPDWTSAEPPELRGTPPAKACKGHLSGVEDADLKALVCRDRSCRDQWERYGVSLERKVRWVGQNLSGRNIPFSKKARMKSQAPDMERFSQRLTEVLGSCEEG